MMSNTVLPVPLFAFVSGADAGHHLALDQTDGLRRLGTLTQTVLLVQGPDVLSSSRARAHRAGMMSSNVLPVKPLSAFVSGADAGHRLALDQTDGLRRLGVLTQSALLVQAPDVVSWSRAPHKRRVLRFGLLVGIASPCACAPAADTRLT